MSKRKKVKNGKRGILKISYIDENGITWIKHNKSGVKKEFDAKILSGDDKIGIEVELNVMYNRTNNITREMRSFDTISDAYNFINKIEKIVLSERDQRRARLGLEPDRSWS